MASDLPGQVSVNLEVSGCSPSVYVPAVFDASEDSRVLKPHTTWDGAWAAAERACTEDLALCRFEVWEMELVTDGDGPGPESQGQREPAGASPPAGAKG